MKSNLLIATTLSLILSACGKPPMELQGFSDSNDTDLATMDDRGEQVKLSRNNSSQNSTRGIIDSARGTNSATYSSFNNYGYSTFMNAFLRYADKIHWENPEITSVARIRIGANIFSNNSISNYCSTWNLKVTSTRPISIQGGSIYSGNGQAYNSSQNEITWTWKSGQKIRAGLIVGVHGQYNSGYCYNQNATTQTTPPVIASFDPFAVAIASNYYNIPYGSDPYQYGWNGNYLGGYYAYPPPTCGAQPIQGQLKVTGTASDCSNGGTVNVNFDLTNEMNQNNGYAPFKSLSINARHEIRARLVNFNGSDWAGVQPPITYSPSYTLKGIFTTIGSGYVLLVGPTYFNLSVDPSIATTSLPSYVGKNVTITTSSTGTGSGLVVKTIAISQ